MALGRSLIADPDWLRKLAEGRDEDIVPCLWDNAGCLDESITEAFHPLRAEPRCGVRA